jgi:glucose-6-phosphate isomerase
MPKTNDWSKFGKYFLENPKYDFSLDISKVNFSDNWLKKFENKFAKAHASMVKLESGEIANPDENRMVGHYWLRNSALAPNKSLSREINQTQAKIKKFATSILSKKIKGAKGAFENILIAGIGGSALGPQFIDHALKPAPKGLSTYFLDNTDPDGIDRTLNSLKSELGKTLVIVISKSGGTKETRNAMLETKIFYKKARLNFSDHAVAITGEGSQLFETATSENWLDIFPMWDWVGGRTSVMSAVGLLPAALAGYNTDNLLKGAKEMDTWTREAKLNKNPAALLSAMWYYLGNGKGEKDMVILPYKDRLELFSKYLQQLIMESLGKRHDTKGKEVFQGIAVYGNKGSTDQHAYIQQLRDGINNFFATFIEVKQSRSGKSNEVEPGMNSGDFLEGFFLGTRKALYESGRESITISVDTVNELNVGRLIALFERAVSFYASYVNINAYHQPGVEAGKKAASDILSLKSEICVTIKNVKIAMSAPQIAQKMKKMSETETIFKLLSFMAKNADSGIKISGPKNGAKTKFKASN